MLPVHVEQLSGGRKGPSVKSEIPQNHVVHVHLLSDSIDGGTRKPNPVRDTSAIVSALSVLTIHYIHRGRRQSLLEDLGKRFANPFQPGRIRTIFEGNDEQGRTGYCLRLGRDDPAQAEDHGQNEQKRFQSSSIIATASRRFPHLRT